MQKTAIILPSHGAVMVGGSHSAFSLGKVPAYKICLWQDHAKGSPGQEAAVMVRSGPVLPQWDEFCNVILQSDPGKCQKLRNLEGYLLLP